MMSGSFSCEQIQAQASEFIDDELAASARVSFDMHLASCDDCSTLIADLTAIRDDAAALPVLVPSRNLWAGIEARIQPTVLPFNAAPVLTAPASRWSALRSRPVMGGIAAALICAVALGRWTASLSSPGTDPAAVASNTPRDVAPAETPVTSAAPTAATPLDSPASLRPESASAPAVARVNRPSAVVTYQREIDALQRVMDDAGEFLDPTTKAVIESSLHTVDSAIAEARAALARDPRSGFVAEQLNKSLERKLGLLRTAALNSSSL